jgi:hypothetical protein
VWIMDGSSRRPQKPLDDDKRTDREQNTHTFAVGVASRRLVVSSAVPSAKRPPKLSPMMKRSRPWYACVVFCGCVWVCVGVGCCMYIYIWHGQSIDRLTSKTQRAPCSQLKPTTAQLF